MIDAKEFNINNYSNLPKGIGMTTIKNRKEGLDSFLKRDESDKNVDLDKLKEQYFGTTQ